MEELPLAIQLKLRETCPACPEPVPLVLSEAEGSGVEERSRREWSRELSGAESAVQEVDVILEDGRTIEGVRVVDCTYVDDDRFEAHLVAEVRLPETPVSPWRALWLLGLLLLGIMAMFYFIRQIQPQ
ncbi:MAG: hypothetical protein ACE10I_06550 [Candidatus Acidiferrales bacterium]